jgi:hypothetical protein
MISYRILMRQRIPISYRKLCEATGAIFERENRYRINNLSSL